MAQSKLLAEWMTERGVDLSELADAASLDRRVVEAIARGRYTPSPVQRQRLSAALEISPEQVAWGHLSHVEHIYGHGPQFGRSP
jgi:transcriptional regulator with XRE-family HTH domain